MPVSARPFIAHDARARLFLALSRGLGAGLPADRALAAAGADLGADLAPRLGAAASAVGKGTGLVEALDRRGFVLPVEKALLDAAERGGRLPAACDALARRHEAAHTRIRRVKGRMLLPLFVAGLGLLVAPFPALYAGAIDAGGYLGLVLGPAAAAGVAWLSARVLWRRWSAHGAPAAIGRIGARVPIAGTLAERAIRASALEDLELLVASGVPAVDALRGCERVRAGTLAGARHAQARRVLERGAGVADALAEAGFVDASGGYAILSAGEGAGRLDETLGRCAAREREALDGAWEQVAAWTPRIAYALVAGWIASGIL